MTQRQHRRNRNHKQILQFTTTVILPILSCIIHKENNKVKWKDKRSEGMQILTWTCEQSKFRVSSMCWRSRPGVQTKILSSLTRSFSVSISLRPPIRTPALKLWYLPTAFNTSKSWPANSLVGDIIMLPTPSSCPHLSLCNFSRTWNMNKAWEIHLCR